MFLSGRFFSDPFLEIQEGGGSGLDLPSAGFNFDEFQLFSVFLDFSLVFHYFFDFVWAVRCGAFFDVFCKLPCKAPQEKETQGLTSRIPDTGPSVRRVAHPFTLSPHNIAGKCLQRTNEY